jgi:hypothetical protein
MIESCCELEDQQLPTPCKLVPSETVRALTELGTAIRPAFASNLQQTYSALLIDGQVAGAVVASAVSEE